MKTPFNAEQFLGVFHRYNEGVIPAQFILFLIGIAIIYLLVSGRKRMRSWSESLTGVVWIWAGLGYHIGYFSVINPASYVFGGLFVIQGIFLIMESVRKKNIFTAETGSSRWYLAVSFMLFGLLIYPLISWLAEGSLALTISFGLPCPTTLFTFGFLLMLGRSARVYLFIIPVLWSLVGISAAMNFGIYQDLTMPLVAGFCLVWWLILQRSDREARTIPITEME